MPLRLLLRVWELPWLELPISFHSRIPFSLYYILPLLPIDTSDTSCSTSFPSSTSSSPPLLTFSFSYPSVMSFYHEYMVCFKTFVLWKLSVLSQCIVAYCFWFQWSWNRWRGWNGCRIDGLKYGEIKTLLITQNQGIYISHIVNEIITNVLNPILSNWI